MAAYRSYMICSSPRSGSTLLCKLLEATGIAGKPKSYFHSPSLEDWLESYEFGIGDYPNVDAARVAVFRAAHAKGRAGSDVFGLRMQGKSLEFFLEQLGKLHPEQSTDVARFQAQFGKPLFIHLTRSDKLGQAVSFVKARQTGLWHKNSDGSELERLSPPAEPVYNRDELVRCKHEFEVLDARWLDWFAQEGINPVTIHYDQLARDPNGELARVLSALKLDPSVAHAVATPTAKLADSTNQDWVRRFRTEDAAPRARY